MDAPAARRPARPSPPATTRAAQGARPRRVPADRSRSRRDRRRRPAGDADRRRRMLWDETIGPGGDAVARAAPRRASCASPTSRATPAPTCSCTTRAQPIERLNVADTVKVQWQAYLGAGSLLLSDMGRVLLSIVADTSGTPRRALRRVEPAAQRGEVRRRRRPRRAPQRAATGSRSRWPSTGSAAATSCPTSTSSRACASRPTARSRFDERAVAAGRVRRAAGRAAGDRRRRQHAARARPPPRVHGRRRCASPRGRMRPTTRADAALVGDARGRARVPATPRSSCSRTRAERRRDRPCSTTRCVAARAPWADVVERGAHAAHRRPRGQPGRRLPPLQRRRSRRALQRARHDRRAGQHLPRRRARSCSPTRAGR